MKRVTGRDLDRIVGLQDWHNRIDQYSGRMPVAAKEAKNVVINSLWMITQE